MLKRRTATKDDLKFIRHSSCKGIEAALKDSEFIINKNTFKKHMGALQTLWEENASIDVLYDDEFPEVVISYVVSERKGNNIHLWWCYTKKDLRHSGMMKTLMEFIVDDCKTATYYFPVRKLHRWYKKTSKDDKVEEFKQKLSISPVFGGISQVAHTNKE